MAQKNTADENTLLPRSRIDRYRTRMAALRSQFRAAIEDIFKSIKRRQLKEIRKHTLS